MDGREPEGTVGGAVESPSRFFAETGHSVSGAFLGFLEHYGLGVCGFPVSDVVVENGVRSQFFQHLVLEETTPGVVRLKPIGEAWLAMESDRRGAAHRGAAPVLREVDLVDVLPRKPAQAYPRRALADIRYLVLHHTGAPADIGARAIAVEHVERNGWPGIGYHYVINALGIAHRTQDLLTVSHHARQFNSVSVGIALQGDLTTTGPPSSQLEGAADLVARLLLDLGLPMANVRGHREMVPTTCPGDAFLAGWKPRLLAAVDARIRGVATPAQPELLPDPSDRG